MFSFLNLMLCIESYAETGGFTGAIRLLSNLYVLGPMTAKNNAHFLSVLVILFATMKNSNLSSFYIRNATTLLSRARILHGILPYAGICHYPLLCVCYFLSVLPVQCAQCGLNAVCKNLFIRSISS